MSSRKGLNSQRNDDGFHLGSKFFSVFVFDLISFSVLGEFASVRM